MDEDKLDVRSVHCHPNDNWITPLFIHIKDHCEVPVQADELTNTLNHQV